MNKNHLKYLGVSLLISILTITGILTSGYDTVETYNNKIPTGVTITRKKGHTGLAYVDENNNETIIESPKNAEIEIGTGDEANYVGKMTGYGADCVGCTGTLACKKNFHVEQL